MRVVALLGGMILLALAVAGGAGAQSQVSLVAYQVKKAKAAPPTADASVNDDFKRLKSGPFFFMIDADTSDSDVDPLPVCLDTSTVPDLNDNGLADDASAALTAANAAADAWDNEVGESLFGTVDGSCAAGDSTIAWGTTVQNAVGQASFLGVDADFATRTAYVTQFEITLSDALDWEIGDTSGADSEFDAQAVMTHELGHPTGLDDLRKLFDFALTMFGSISPDRPPNTATLGCGDILGVQTIYGEALDCTGAPDD